jgi:N-acetylmuramoyl-L-alanine amidase
MVGRTIGLTAVLTVGFTSMGFALSPQVVSATPSTRSCIKGGHRVGVDAPVSTDVTCGLSSHQIETAMVGSSGCYPRFDALGFSLCATDGSRSDSGGPGRSVRPSSSTRIGVLHPITRARAGATVASIAGRRRQLTRTSLPEPPPITASFIPFPQKRKDEMRAYSLRHYGINSYRLIDPHLIIWHYTDSTTYPSVYNTFADDVPDVQFHELPQVCTHFVITTHGTIHQLVPLILMCRQVVGLNYTSLGIENVGESDQQVLDDAGQYRASLRLTRWLRCRFHIPVRNVIGHNESLQSPYFRELVPAFRGQTHSDFDRRDMNIVRAAVARLGC